tara:strand:- start:761 stop:1744 length:984 start_codon:yes stop_codon:yes gene_type:complete
MPKPLPVLKPDTMYTLNDQGLPDPVDKDDWIAAKKTEENLPPELVNLLEVDPERAIEWEQARVKELHENRDNYTEADDVGKLLWKVTGNRLGIYKRSREEILLERFREKYPDAEDIRIDGEQVHIRFPETDAVSHRTEQAGSWETPEELERQKLQSDMWDAFTKAVAANKARAPDGLAWDAWVDDETVRYGEEQDPGSLLDERRGSFYKGLGKALTGMGEGADQAEYAADQQVMRTPGYVPETRGEASDRHHGPVPEELLLHVSDEPLTRGEATPAWDTTPVVGEKDQDLIKHTLSDGTVATERRSRETPSQKAARVALLKEQEDTD